MYFCKSCSLMMIFPMLNDTLQVETQVVSLYWSSKYWLIKTAHFSANKKVVTGVTAKMYIKKILPQYSLAAILVAKLYWGCVKLYWVYVLACKNHSQIIPVVYFGYDFCGQTIPGVCFGYNFRMPQHTPGIVVHGGICLPVTPALYAAKMGSLRQQRDFPVTSD